MSSKVNPVFGGTKKYCYYELLRPGDRYRLQLTLLSRTLLEKRPEYEKT